MVVRVQPTFREIFPPEPSHDRALGGVHRQVVAKGNRHVLLALGGLDRYILRDLSFSPLTSRSTPRPSANTFKNTLCSFEDLLFPRYPLLPLTKVTVPFQP